MVFQSLEFDGATFDRTSFRQRVAEFLQHRSAEPDDGREISFEFSPASTDRAIFDELMGCAASHGLQQLRVLGSHGYLECTSQSDAVFRSILTRCGRSLEILNLEEFKFDVLLTFDQDCSGFRALTALSLSDCVLDFCALRRLNPFAHFPALKQLSLSSCGRHLGSDDDPFFDEATLKVNGDQLLALEIIKPDGFNEIKVSAPRLTSFTYWDEINDYHPLTQVSLNVPSLEAADIKLTGYRGLDVPTKKEAQEMYASLFRDLRRARSLILEFDTAIALYDACKVEADQPPVFERLESLTLNHPEEYIALVPYYVKRYFFGDNPPEPEYGETATVITRP